MNDEEMPDLPPPELAAAKLYFGSCAQHLSVSENRGSEYSTLNNRILVIPSEVLFTRSLH